MANAQLHRGGVEAQQPIRIAGLIRGMLYAAAAKRRAFERGWRPQESLKLPGLENPSSQLGVPLVVRGELVGVLCIESETPYRFHEEDKNAIELLGASLAIAIQNMQKTESEEPPAVERAASTSVNPPVTDSGKPGGRKREVAYYKTDEVVMIDGDYLIRSLPARILWKLLQTHKREGRAEFTNRELRLDKSLNLPVFKDNLETRLLLLRRRLDQKGDDDIRLVPKGRGRFALELGCAVELVEKP